MFIVMIMNEEWAARIRDFFRFSREEMISLGVVILIGGFLFSLRFPGEIFTIQSWTYHFILAALVAAISIVIKTASQKMQALKHGYYAEFHIVWIAVIASLLIGIFSRGYLPVLFFGAISTSFMVRQRLGEFRYGYSFEDNANLILNGITTCLTLATIFALGSFLFPDSYFFTTGIIFNLVLAACTLVPIPKMDGLALLFGSKFLFTVGVGSVILYSLLLLSGTKIGLVLAIMIGVINKIVSLLWTA
jgi:Zn-dependent protease